MIRIFVQLDALNVVIGDCELSRQDGGDVSLLPKNPDPRLIELPLDHPDWKGLGSLSRWTFTGIVAPLITRLDRFTPPPPLAPLPDPTLLTDRQLLVLLAQKVGAVKIV